MMKDNRPWWERRFFIWHALFDGTWLCRCNRSKEMKNWSKRWTDE